MNNIEDIGDKIINKLRNNDVKIIIQKYFQKLITNKCLIKYILNEINNEEFNEYIYKKIKVDLTNNDFVSFYYLCSTLAYRNYKDTNKLLINNLEKSWYYLINIKKYDNYSNKLLYNTNNLYDLFLLHMIDNKDIKNIELIEKEMFNSNTIGLLLYGLIYYKKFNIKKHSEKENILDFKKAMIAFHILAGKNNSFGYIFISLCYKKGVGCKIDTNKYEIAFKKAYDLNNPIALTHKIHNTRNINELINIFEHIEKIKYKIYCPGKLMLVCDYYKNDIIKFKKYRNKLRCQYKLLDNIFTIKYDKDKLPPIKYFNKINYLKKIKKCPFGIYNKKVIYLCKKFEPIVLNEIINCLLNGYGTKINIELANELLKEKIKRFG